jgi:hypothetical protein
MQYTVPQFIDQEDKIVGPITVRQFLIMIVAAIFIAIAYALLSFIYFVFTAILIAAVTVVVAFVKINGRPFHFFLISFVERTKKANVRVWNKELTDSELKHYLKVKKEEKPEERAKRPKLTTSHLSQLTLIVDSGGSYGGEDVFEAVQPPPPEKSKKKK